MIEEWRGRADSGKVVASAVLSTRCKRCAARPRAPLSRCDAMPAREPASLCCYSRQPLTFARSVPCALAGDARRRRLVLELDPHELARRPDRARRHPLVDTHAEHERCRSWRRPASRALDLAQVQQGGARSSSMCLRASAGERMCMPARRAVTSARAHGDCQCMAAQPCGCANSNLHVCGNDTSAAESENLASLNKFKYGKFRNVRACCDGSEHTNMRSCCDGRVVCQYGI